MNATPTTPPDGPFKTAREYDQARVAAENRYGKGLWSYDDAFMRRIEATKRADPGFFSRAATNSTK